MEALPRDSTTEKPVKDQRVPVAKVTFTQPVPVPGFVSMYTVVESGVYRLDSGENKAFPQVFWDREWGVIQIEDMRYPLERVVCWTRANAARVKVAPPPMADYTIGKHGRDVLRLSKTSK